MVRGMLGRVFNKILNFDLLLSSNDCSMHAQKKAMSFHICSLTIKVTIRAELFTLICLYLAMRVYIWLFRPDTGCSDLLSLVIVQGYYEVCNRATYLHVRFLTGHRPIYSVPKYQPFLLFPQ